MGHDGSLFRGLVERGACGLLLVDGAGIVRLANPMARELLEADLVGNAFASRFIEGAEEACAAFIFELISRAPSAGPASFTTTLTRSDGYLTQLEVRGVNGLNEPGLEGLILSVADVTRWHAELQDLKQRAFHDPLTGLANRNLFLDRLRQAIRGGGAGSTAMLDIDYFKRINDRYGHQIGDQVLVLIAQRFSGTFREAETVARLGGEEFGLILPGVAPDEARGLIEQMSENLVGPSDIVCDGEALMMPTLSAGITGFGGGAEDTLRECDVALYAAKTAGRDRVIVYGPDVRSSIVTRRDMAERITDLTEQNKQLKEMARTDALTRIPNRWTYEEIKQRVFGSPDCEWSRGC